MPELSIVVPVYNAQAFLHDCVQSILSQDYVDFELLLVDDGSTDGSAGICDSYVKKDRRVRVFHKPNGGVSSARNYGLDKVNGRYLIFADADDWFEEHAFSKLVREATLQDLTFYGSVFHYEAYEESRSPDAFHYASPSGLQRGLLLLAYNKECPDYVGFTWNKVFKVSIIKKHGLHFVEGLSIREDEIFTLNYAAYCKTMVTLPDLLYHYRKHSFGLTAGKNDVWELRLLVACFRQVIDLYSDTDFKDYIYRQSVKFLFLAVRVSIDKDMRKDIIRELWSYSRQRRDCSVPVKFLYRMLLRLPSPKPLQMFMEIRSLYYRLKA